MKKGRKKLIEQCRQRLLEIKEKRLKLLENLSGELARDSSGDVADQAKALQDETISMAQRNKLAGELQEIDEAIQRLDDESFGICEVTGAPIEEKRLLAIPWTRLSVEGAEMQEMGSEY